jgi:hypothetical protein
MKQHLNRQRLFLADLEEKQKVLERDKLRFDERQKLLDKVHKQAYKHKQINTHK